MSASRVQLGGQQQRSLHTFVAFCQSEDETLPHRGCWRPDAETPSGQQNAGMSSLCRFPHQYTGRSSSKLPSRVWSRPKKWLTLGTSYILCPFAGILICIRQGITAPENHTQLSLLI